MAIKFNESVLNLDIHVGGTEIHSHITGLFKTQPGLSTEVGHELIRLCRRVLAAEIDCIFPQRVPVGTAG